MGEQTTEQLLTEIEYLRNKLHTIVGKNATIHSNSLQDKELLDVSKQLDYLILKYMTKK